MPQVKVLPQNEEVTINNIFLVGRNYTQDPSERSKRAAAGPVVTLKPTSAVILDGEKIRLPVCSKRVIYEAELLILIGREGKNIAETDALKHVLAYGVGIDVIAYDLHEQAKAKGLPWTVSKGFDTFAPLSAFIDAGKVADPQRAMFTLDVNGERRQNGDAAHQYRQNYQLSQ
jgi:2-keto-4-pentenoate hydratase/2-oxohepta-3-ene-1,7-dioic acid hydratase in catechol pathway